MSSSGTLGAALHDLQWLQRLAALLTRDPDEADDLVQQTLVVAWTHPPRDHEQPVRPWLSTVLRNVFKMQRRADTRRTLRQQAGGSASHTAAAPDHELARVEILHILARELEQLPPDDQKILVRRFIDGEHAADIARALGLPAATVRSRIHRSLARLRDSLDTQHGPRARWSLAVLAAPAVPVPSIPTKGSDMSIVAKAILVTTTVGAAGLAGWLGLAEPPPPSRPADPPATTAPLEPTITPAATTPRSAWEQRRRTIRQILPPGKPAPTPQQQRRGDGLHALIGACMTDLDSTASGAMTMSITEIGAPDIGTIYDDVTIVETTFPEQEVLQCLVQSMHAWVGAAPVESFEHSYTSTFVLGTPTPDLAQTRIFEAIIGAHISEVRYCERRGDTNAPEVRGHLDLAFTLIDRGDGYCKSNPSIAGSTDLPQAVVDCIVTASERWAFPITMQGHTREYHYTLPIPPVPIPGPAQPPT